MEVHTDREMEIALDCGARVIGVNNRNLHSFQLDLKTTERILQVAQRKQKSWRIGGSSEPDLLIAALSGITSSEVLIYLYCNLSLLRFPHNYQLLLRVPDHENGLSI